MSDERQLTCPVCRARQKPQVECRRCHADLSLYLKALRSEETARDRYVEACRAGDQEAAARALSYLHWLTPRQARALAHPPGDRPDRPATWSDADR